MKQEQIKVGGVYLAKVSGRLTLVKVNEIKEWPAFGGSKIRYRCTNMKTLREILVRSAARFREEVKEQPTKVIRLTGVMVPGDDGGLTND